MLIPTYDIFAGRYGETGIRWIACVEGLVEASERMKRLAAENPGPYFIFDVSSRALLASVDTSDKPKRKTRAA